MAGVPIMHENDVNVNMDAHKLVVLAAMPDDYEKLTQRVIGWDKYFGAKSGNLHDTQKVYEGRHSLEIVCGNWLDDAKGTPEDPGAVRSRLVATQVNTCIREEVTQAATKINEGTA